MPAGEVARLFTSISRIALPLPRSRFSAAQRIPLMGAAPAPVVQTARRTFATSAPRPSATYMQIVRGCRKPQPARHKVSPALGRRPELKGVCLKVGITTPKKPNSGERKTCRVRLSTGRVVTAVIPGEGHNLQQHNIVVLRGGRAQDCPGVRYTCIRGAGDLTGVPNRATSRSKFGTKKPKADA